MKIEDQEEIKEEESETDSEYSEHLKENDTLDEIPDNIN